MLYTIKIKENPRQYIEQEPNRCGWNRVFNFEVKELGYQDSISISAEGFTKLKARKMIRAKIKGFLAEKAKEKTSQEEYTEEI